MKITTTVSLLALCFALYYSCVQRGKTASIREAVYVGSEKCQSCHPKEYANYLVSDHFHAMDSALPRSVKGDFNNSIFVYDGDTTFFYERDGRYYIRTNDSTGAKSEFPVSFTFGWRPLQQYLVRFPDGRVQALPFCWDTRPKENGGQHWFHIYGKEKILPGDDLFWTGINQNWNYMCADCHTTNYSKNFDAVTNTFHSSWDESKVSCESCHGPASLHLEWTKKKSADDNLKGFSINLAGKKPNWTFNKEKGIAYPDTIVQNTGVIEICARCHARASRLTDRYHHGESFLQSHIPSTISTVNYYADGQIREEDYEYGSFLQSRMYAMGVSCVDCHDPHTMNLKKQGNEVCSSCHSPAKFEVEDHTHHRAGSLGSLCVNCHMPVTNYMVIDARRDHSIRVPRPDLSEQMNVPNACNKCHLDKPVGWAVRSFQAWYGKQLPVEKTYGQLLYIASRKTAESESSLYNLLVSKNYPAIAKATALEQNNDFYTPRLVEQLNLYLQSPDPNLRSNALHAASNLPGQARIQAVAPLLDDSILAVRLQAMNVLAPLSARLDENQSQMFNAVLNEYLAVQNGLADRPESYLNKGIILATVGRMAEAEECYRAGVARFPKFIAYYANIADLYRSENNEVEAKNYLDKGLLMQPANAALHYATALWYIRNQSKQAGLNELQKATELAPSDASFTYGYALALSSLQRPEKAIGILQQYTLHYGNDASILSALISECQQERQTKKSDYYLSVRRSVFGY